MEEIEVIVDSETLATTFTQNSVSRFYWVTGVKLFMIDIVQ